MFSVSLRRFASLVLFVHVILEVFCLAVPTWHRSTALRQTSSAVSLTLSPHEWCIDAVCSSYSDYPYPIGTCNPSSGTVAARARVAQAMFILTACLSFIAAVLLVFLTDEFRLLRMLTFVIIFLSFACNVIGAGIFADFVLNVVVCTNGPCFHLRVLFSTLVSCRQEFEYPFYLASIATVFPIMAFILASVSSCLSSQVRRSPAEKYESPHSPDGAKTRFVEAPQEMARTHETPVIAAKEVPRAVEVTPSTVARPQETTAPSNPLTNGNVAPRPATPAHHPATPEHGQGEAALPPGEWEYDGESGLYWSQEQFLFFHADSGQFYDPNTQQWYNPDTDEWYTA